MTQSASTMVVVPTDPPRKITIPPGPMSDTETKEIIEKLTEVSTSIERSRAAGVERGKAYAARFDRNEERLDQIDKRIADIDKRELARVTAERDALQAKYARVTYAPIAIFITVVAAIITWLLTK